MSSQLKRREEVDNDRCSGTKVDDLDDTKSPILTRTSSR